jgi:hypothetical protein
MHGGDEEILHNLVEKPERKRALRIHTRRWEDNIKKNLKGIGFGY